MLECLFLKQLLFPKLTVILFIWKMNFLDSAIQQLGMPLIVKEAFGSFGEQVYLANNLSELKELVFHHSDQPLMLQQFISTSYGRDVRIQVVGNQVIAAMERRAQNDF